MLILNNSGTPVIEEGIIELLATGSTDKLPSKIMVEVKNQIATISSSIGTGNGKFENGYTYAEPNERYDYKIVDQAILNIIPSVTTVNGDRKLTVTFKADVGGGVTLQDWWQTECTGVEIVRIDLLSDNNTTIARQEPSGVTFPYSAGIDFDFNIVINPDQIGNNIETIDNEWLTDLGQYISGNPTYTQSNFKVDYVEFYDDSDVLLTDEKTNLTSNDLALTTYSHAQYTYRGVTSSVRPDGTPKYFQIKTDQGRKIYQNDFNWSPEWLAGDTIDFSYSV